MVTPLFGVATFGKTGRIIVSPREEVDKPK
jgi:hypothetical protein